MSWVQPPNTRNRVEELFFHKCVTMGSFSQGFGVDYTPADLNELMQRKQQKWRKWPKMLIFLWHGQQQTQNHSRLDVMVQAYVSSSTWGYRQDCEFDFIQDYIVRSWMKQINKNQNQPNKQTKR